LYATGGLPVASAIRRASSIIIAAVLSSPTTWWAQARRFSASCKCTSAPVSRANRSFSRRCYRNPVVQALLERGKRVRALVRRKETDLPDGVERAVGDLNEPGSVPALAGVQGVLLLPGYRGMPDLLTRARAAGVERVVLLSWARRSRPT
jgi:hypothetical protein